MEKSKFKKAYLIFLAICVALVAIAFVVLWIKLYSYQKNLDSNALNENSAVESDFSDSSPIDTKEDEHNAQMAFEEYVDSLTEDEWCVLYRQSHPSCIDSDEDIKGFINEHIIPACASKYRAADYTSSSPKYLIGSEDSAVASFIMSKTGDNWIVSESRILTAGSESISLTVAGGCELSSGSTILDAIEPSTKTATVDDYSEDLIEPVILCSYEFNNCINADASFDFVNAYKSNDGIYYSTEEDTSEFVSKAEAFVKALLKCYIEGKTNYQANISATLAHVDSSSTAAKVIRETESGLEWTTPDNSISLNIVSSPVCVVADNCRFVEVTCENGSVYKVFFLDRGNGFKIVQFYCL